MKVKKALFKSHELLIESNVLYFKEEDQEGNARTLSRTARTMNHAAYYCANNWRWNKVFRNPGTLQIRLGSIQGKLKINDTFLKLFLPFWTNDKIRVLTSLYCKHGSEELFSPDLRKSYAEKAITYGEKSIQTTIVIPVSTWIYQMCFNIF